MSYKWYKKGQGYYTRLFSGLTAFIIQAFGCYALYDKLQGKNIWIVGLVPAGLCVIFSLLILWLVNKPNVADFLISAEGEMKKVSWSSRREIMVSTGIVIGVVCLFAVLLFFADMGFRYLFMEVIGI